MPPDHRELLLGDDHPHRDHRDGPLRIGIGGPVGSGKTALVAALCRSLGGELSVAVVTNDIYTTEDADFLRRNAVLPDDRIEAVQTGCCPHTAIRDDITANRRADRAAPRPGPDPALAARLTGSGSVHLVGTAAGPLGGDTVDLAVTVAAGARLRVRSTAASVVLPSTVDGPSRTALTLDVAGALDLALEPTVVTARAIHMSTVDARLTGDGRLRLTEQVVLGRAGEGPGRWTGTVRVGRDGGPVLHASQELGPGGAGWADPFTPRAYVSELVLDGSAAGPGVGEDSVRLPLPGGWTATAWAQSLDTALARLLPAAPLVAAGAP